MSRQQGQFTLIKGSAVNTLFLAYPRSHSRHIRAIIHTMEYRGEENKTIYILLPDGYTHRVRVWWKETPKSLNEKFIQRFGEKCYKLELWQTKLVNAETRQEADMLLNENSKAYNTRVGSLEK